jgi:hypothetical protein
LASFSQSVSQEILWSKRLRALWMSSAMCDDYNNILNNVAIDISKIVIKYLA